MGEAKEKTLNLKASDIEACRICLATEVKMYSLQDTHLGTCMESISGFAKSYEGLPNYVCYECAPCLIKCNKLIEKSKAAGATLLDIFNKNRQISKSLIEDQNRLQLKLQSSLDSYLLLNYFYIKYDDENNTSNFIQAESDTKEPINIKLKNEIKDESPEELLNSEILNILKDTIDIATGNAKMDSDSDIEAIDVQVPVVEIVSDDEKIGDDFISLKSYKVKMDKRADKLMARNFDVPIYHVPKVKGISKRGIAKKAKNKKKKKATNIDTLSSVDPNEAYVQKYFKIDVIPPIPASKTVDKKYSCKFCPETFDCVDDAKDHTFIGCTIPQISNGDKTAFPKPGPGTNSTVSNQPRTWNEWPGSK